MRIEFLIEDKSGSKLIDEIMKKYNEELRQLQLSVIDYNIKSYKGVGGLKKGKNVENIKSLHLLSELPKRLLALQNQLQWYQDSAVFIVLDNDKRNTELFYSELNELAEKYNIKIDCVFCIAVEEIEAWLLGDCKAIMEAYPKLKDRIRTKHANYIQDSICNTWEYLADILTPKGINEFKRKNNNVYDIGKKKIEWATEIGACMDIRNNNSPSFNRFIEAIDCRAKCSI